MIPQSDHYWLLNAQIPLSLLVDPTGFETSDLAAVHLEIKAGSFASALTAVETDRNRHWNAEDLYRRMEFGLKSAYAHGSSAIRTHIDAFGEQAKISLEAFSALRHDWADRITLEAAALVTLDYYRTPAGEQLADLMAEVGGCLGGCR